MTNLQILFLLVSITFLIFSLQIYKKKKIWILTFLFFFCGALTVGILSLRMEWLNAIGITFWLNRGADLIVYLSIIMLFYLSLNLYNRAAHLSRLQTQLMRSVALEKAKGSLGDAKIVFVIPAYNEDQSSIAVLQSVLDAGCGVVAVDDGSSNAMFSEWEQVFSTQEGIVLLQHVVNSGQGAALQTGFDYLLRYGEGIEYVVTFDADGQHDLWDLPVFLHAFEQDKELEVVLWSRFLGSAVNMPLAKKIVLKIWILFTFFFSGLWLTDTHNGYRVIKFSALKKIRLTFNGMEHASEILELIHQQRIPYHEVANTIRYSAYSMARGQKLSNSVRIVRNLVFRKFFGK